MTSTQSTQEAERATGLLHTNALCEDRRAPLVLLVHGRAGNAQVMWAFRRCFPEGVSFLCPQAFLADEVGGWSWWNVRDHAPVDFPPPPSSSAALRPGIDRAKDRLLAFLDRSLTLYGLEPRALIAVGFSQGAGLLSALAQRYPQRFSGVALLAGFVLPEPAPETRELPSVFVAHGEQDEIVPLPRCIEGVDFLKGHGFSVELVLDPVGHKVGTSGMRALKVWAERVLGGGQLEEP